MSKKKVGSLRDENVTAPATAAGGREAFRRRLSFNCRFVLTSFYSGVSSVFLG